MTVLQAGPAIVSEPMVMEVLNNVMTVRDGSVLISVEECLVQLPQTGVSIVQSVSEVSLSYTQTKMVKPVFSVENVIDAKLR